MIISPILDHWVKEYEPFLRPLVHISNSFQKDYLSVLSQQCVCVCVWGGAGRWVVAGSKIPLRTDCVL